MPVPQPDTSDPLLQAQARVAACRKTLSQVQHTATMLEQASLVSVLGSLVDDLAQVTHLLNQAQTDRARLRKAVRDARTW